MQPEPELPTAPEAHPPSPSLLTRRRVLGLLGIAGVGLAAAPLSSHLGPALSVLCSEKWKKLMTPPSPARTITLIDQDHYGNFLKSQNLRHLTIAKILASHAKERNGVRNELPPINLWPRLIPTLHVADLLSERLDEEVQVVVSAYRSPEYNAMCPGSARNSQHLQNNALDLIFKSPSIKVAEAARELRAKGLFRGGVGHYPSFTHIDTRGRNSDWQNI